MGPHEFERWIIARTELIVTARLMKQKGLTVMPLEIKGLKGKALKARANIDALNSAYDKFNETAPAHAADVEGLTSQVSGMQDDLQFAVNVLGNSTSESEKLAEKPKQEVPSTLAHEPPALPRMPADTPQSWQTALQQEDPPQDPSRAIVR